MQERSPQRLKPARLKSCPPELQGFAHKRLTEDLGPEDLYIEHAAKERKVFTHFVDVFLLLFSTFDKFESIHRSGSGSDDGR